MHHREPNLERSDPDSAEVQRGQIPNYHDLGLKDHVMAFWNLIPQYLQAHTISPF